MFKTGDIKNEFIKLYNENNFRILGGGNEKQQSKTLEIQNVQFEVDKPWIIREPNYKYASKEIDWYNSESLNVYDIKGGAPKMWVSCADALGYINSNYGWMIFSKDNYEQYKSCLNMLIKDPFTREACMIYNRPSMQVDYNKNGMHDFCCTYSTQCFLNYVNDETYSLKYIVYMRSNDAVFGFNNDALWHQYVQKRLVDDLYKNLNKKIILEPIIWHAGSLHIYERHFKYILNN